MVEHASPRLYNADLAPATERRWGVYSMAALWMSILHNIGTYTFAMGFFFLGLGVWQVFLALLVGALCVYVLLNLTAMAGQRTGVPYPVLARISFGVFGANIPALIRAVVAIFWYGIQTYLASAAVVILLLRVAPGLGSLADGAFLGLSPLGWISFLVLWALQLLVINHGMESVRRFQNWAGPAIYAVMFALAIWILVKADWKVSLNLSTKELSSGQAVKEFAIAVALFVGYWGTYMLNFCDFSRFCPDRRSVRVGNLLGLPINLMVFALTTAIITGGSIEVYGAAVTDPVELVGRIPSTVAVVLGALGFAIATIGVNVVGNFVSPAFDLSNAWPSRISFRRGGLIAAVVSVFVMPWELYSSPVAINYFIAGVAALLGPLYGIIVVDYYLIKRGRIDIAALYREGPESPYWYVRGLNHRAVAAFVPAAAISVVVALVPWFGDASAFSWILGAGLSGLFYWGSAARQLDAEVAAPVSSREGSVA